MMRWLAQALRTGSHGERAVGIATAIVHKDKRKRTSISLVVIEGRVGTFDVTHRIPCVYKVKDEAFTVSKCQGTTDIANDRRELWNRSARGYN